MSQIFIILFISCQWKKICGSLCAIWAAEFDAKCVEASLEKRLFKDFTVLVGDQSNKSELLSWISQSKGDFKIVIDDGGHKNKQIQTSFDTLFHEMLSPGGYYFIEDLHVGRRSQKRENFPFAFVDRIKSWIHQLIIADDSRSILSHQTGNPQAHPLPPTVDWILCQHEACVITKKQI